MRQLAAEFIMGSLLDELIDQRMTRHRQPACHLLQAPRHAQQFGSGQYVKRQLAGAVQVGVERGEDPLDVVSTIRTHVRIVSRPTDSPQSYPQGMPSVAVLAVIVV